MTTGSSFFLSSFSAAFEKEIELISLIPQSCALREPFCSLLFAHRLNLFYNQLLMQEKTSASNAGKHEENLSSEHIASGAVVLEKSSFRFGGVKIMLLKFLGVSSSSK